MILLNTTTPILNSAAPSISVSQTEKDLFALGKSIWLEGDSRFIVPTSDGLNIARWVNRYDGSAFVPYGSKGAAIQSYTTKRAARFGYGNGLAPGASGLNGALKSEGSLSYMNATGVYTLVLLARVAALGTEGNSAPGGAPFGSMVASGYMDFAFNNGTFEGFYLKHDPSAVISLPSQTVKDGVWRLYTVSCDTSANEAVIRVNGTQVGIKSGTIPALSSGTGFDQAMLGCAGSTANLPPFSGDIGSVFYLPNTAIHRDSTKLALVENYFLGLKALFV